MGMNLVFDFGAVLFHWQPAQLVAESFPDLAATPQAVQQTRPVDLRVAADPLRAGSGADRLYR